MKNKILLALTCMTIGFSACQKSDDLTAPETSENYTSGDYGKYGGTTYQLVAQLKQATAKYQNYQVALNEGFYNTEECVAIPGVGGMGVHFVNFGRLDGTHNPLEPEVLVYEVKNNGSYKLVAIEYLYVGNDAPMFGGEVMFHPFPEPFADYALHVWAWKANPAGLFEDWNPNITCE